MKKHFDSIKKRMKLDSELDSEIGCENFHSAYWLGFIHGMHEAGCIFVEEREELVAYKESLFPSPAKVL